MTTCHRIAFACAVLALGAGPASAEVKTNREAKVSVDVPPTWKISGKGDVMTLVDPTGEVSFIMIVTTDADLKNVVASLDKNMARIATDVKWESEKLTRDNLNDMEVLVNKGKGKVGGKDAELGLILAKTPANKILIVVAAVDSDKTAAHKEEIYKLLHSIKPAP